MEVLRGHGVHIQYPVSIPRAEDVWPSLCKIMRTSTVISQPLDMADNAEEHEFHPSMNEYLKGLEHSKVRSLEELVQFNREHAELELPPGMLLLSSLFALSVSREMSNDYYRISITEHSRKLLERQHHGGRKPAYFKRNAGTCRS